MNILYTLLQKYNICTIITIITQYLNSKTNTNRL